MPDGVSLAEAPAPRSLFCLVLRSPHSCPSSPLRFHGGGRRDRVIDWLGGWIGVRGDRAAAARPSFQADARTEASLHAHLLSVSPSASPFLLWPSGGLFRPVVASAGTCAPLPRIVPKSTRHYAHWLLSLPARLVSQPSPPSS